MTVSIALMPISMASFMRKSSLSRPVVKSVASRTVFVVEPAKLRLLTTRFLSVLPFCSLMPLMAVRTILTRAGLPFSSRIE